MTRVRERMLKAIRLGSMVEVGQHTRMRTGILSAILILLAWDHRGGRHRLPRLPDFGRRRGHSTSRGIRLCRALRSRSAMRSIRS
jgi:hypothetical protein